MLTAYREQVRVLVDEHRGRTVVFTGDNFLAEFPAALEAVRCAIEIQRVLKARNAALPVERRLQFRIGVNLGDIREEDGHLYGDGINIAARLETLADPGGICLSDAVHAQVHHRVDAGFEDMGPQALKNIPDPVRAYRVRLDAPAADAAPLAPPPPRARPVWPAVVALVLAIAGVLFFRGRNETPVPPPVPKAEDKPSIAVLPFVNMSGDDEQEYFADGMTEDLITDLSTLSGLEVIARTSSFYYKGKHLPVQEIARELDVQFLLEGSVRKVGDRVRITAQLIEAATGHHVWSDRYDRPLEEVFALQDEVTAKIVEALAVTLTDSEQAQAAVLPTENLEAYDWFLRGRVWIEQAATREGNIQARKLIERAVALDPQFSTAYTYLSWTYLMDWFSQWNTDPAVLEQSEALARKAVELNGADSFALAHLATIHVFKGNPAEGLRLARRGVAAAPHAWSYQSLAMALQAEGRLAPALDAANKALRLNPHDVWTFSVRGQMLLRLERYKEAVADFRRSTVFLPDFLPPYIQLAFAYDELGEKDQARWAVNEIYRISPTFVPEMLRRDAQPFASAEFTERLITAIKRYPPAEAAAASEKPAIAVLPFVNMSGDAEQEYFVDGMTEDLITDLSKISGLLVIARTSAFSYKGKNIKVQEVARDLDVQYVVEGSVRKVGDRVRITAQLVDATTGHHLWSERYDRELADIFALQDEVTGEIVRALRVKLAPGEQDQVALIPTDNLEAYDLYLRGQARLLTFTREGVLHARELFERAIELDPQFGLAYTGRAYTYLQEAAGQWSVDPTLLGRAKQDGERAIQLQDTQAESHGMLCLLYTLTGRTLDAVRAGRRAVALNPNNADAHADFGLALVFAENAEDGIPSIERAIRLDPHNVSAYVNLGIGYLALRRYEEAAQQERHALSIAPNFVPARVTLIVAYAELGDMEQARAEAATLLHDSPNYTIANARRLWSGMPQHIEVEDFYNALRRAGIPEGESPEATAAVGKPAIAVLPFANMSGDPEQEYFADGMTEDLITDLSKISGLLVIARNSVFTYKGKSVKVQEVARDLDVQYVVEGSVRKAGDRVRITAQLVDATTGHHLWSERYDRELTDVFALQDEVTGAIVSALRVTLTPEEQTRVGGVPTQSPEAYDAYLRGLAAFWADTEANAIRARALFEEALVHDPTFADAHAWAAGADMLLWANQWTRDPAVLERASARTRQAVTLNPQLATGHGILSAVLVFTREFEAAVASANHARALEPHNPNVLQTAAFVYNAVSRPADALDALDLAVRLDPARRPQLGYEYGVAYNMLGRNEQALTHLQEMVMRFPDVLRARSLLTRTYAEMGRLDEARAEAREMLRLNPDWTIAGFRRMSPGGESDYRDRGVAAYRKAGLPEGDPAAASD